jgi:hypothetical protein
VSDLLVASPYAADDFVVAVDLVRARSRKYCELRRFDRFGHFAGLTGAWPPQM